MSTAVYGGTLLDDVVRERGTPRELVRQAAGEILYLIREGLLADGQVRIQNFGTFKIKEVAARRGKHPQTGEPITIPAQRRVIFSPCKALREMIEPNKRKPIPVQESPSIAVVQTVENETPASMPPGEQEPLPPYKQKRSPIVYWVGGSALALLLAMMAVQRFGGGKELTQQAQLNPAPMVTASAPVTEAKPQAPAQSTSTYEVQNKELLLDQTLNGSSQTAVEEAHGPKVVSPATTDTPSIFFSQRDYQLRYGDSLWRLAARHYQDPLLWPHIYQANGKLIDNPDNLQAKQHLTLPALEGQPGHLSKTDRYNIAEGYYQVYVYYKKSGHKDAFFALLEAKRYSPQLVEEKRGLLRLTTMEAFLLSQQTSIEEGNLTPTPRS